MANYDVTCRKCTGFIRVQAPSVQAAKQLAVAAGWRYEGQVLICKKCYVPHTVYREKCYVPHTVYREMPKSKLILEAHK